VSKQRRENNVAAFRLFTLQVTTPDLIYREVSNSYQVFLTMLFKVNKLSVLCIYTAHLTLKSTI